MKTRLIQYKINNPNHQVIRDKDIISFLNGLYADESLKIKAAMYLNDLETEPKCYCGNHLEFLGQSKAELYVTVYGGWRKYCSRLCMQKSTETISKRKATTKERFGVESYSQIQEFKPLTDDQKQVATSKRVQTSLIKYGVEHYSKTQEYLDKRELTSLSKHGVTNTFLLKNKIQDTMLSRYGYATWLNSKDADISRRTRIISKEEKLQSYISLLSNKGINNELIDILVNRPDEFKDYIEQIVEKNNYTNRYEISQHIGYSISHTNKMFRKFGMSDDYLITKGHSFAESEIKKFLDELNVEYITSDRIILAGLELDVYIPKYNLAIEYDGIYWHSERMGKDDKYHLNKTIKCEENRIQLLHIFENEWIDLTKREIWKSIIRNKLRCINSKIGSRKCEFKIISKNDAEEFLDKNHLNGYRHASDHYGLFYENEIVSVMSIGKSIHGENEIVRFASKINTIVHGALSKFLANIDVKNLITYADRRFSSSLNNAYQKLFQKKDITSPNWYGIECGELKHRLSYTKQKVKAKLGSQYDNTKSVIENMNDNGIDRIWDCGNLKFW